MTRAKTYCSCEKGSTKYHEKVTLRQVEYVVMDGLDLCSECFYSVVWLTDKEAMLQTSKRNGMIRSDKEQ